MSHPFIKMALIACATYVTGCASLTPTPSDKVRAVPAGLDVMTLPRAPEIAVFVTEPETVVWRGGRSASNTLRNQSVHWVQTTAPGAHPSPIPSKPIPLGQLAPSQEHKFATVLFPVNSAELASTDLDRLGDFGGKDVSAVQIDAHADSTGGAEYNRRLSERRGKAVASTLKKHGTPEGAITINAHGEDSPIASNETSDGRAANRRVTVDVVKAVPDQKGVNDGKN